MSAKKNTLITAIMILAVSVFVLAFVSQSQAAKSSDVVTKDSIGFIDLDKLQKEYPKYVHLQESVQLYNKELNDYKAYLRQELSTYLAELEQKQKDEQDAAKSEAAKKDIEAKYAQLAQAKAAEMNKSVQQKGDELTQKLKEEQTAADASLRGAVTAVAAKKDLKLVLVKSALYFGGVDVTTDVLAKGKELK